MLHTQHPKRHFNWELAGTIGFSMAIMVPVLIYLFRVVNAALSVAINLNH